MDAGLVSVREQARPAAQQSKMNCYVSVRKSTAVWMCWKESGRWHAQNRYGQSGDYRHCRAVGYLNFRRVAPGWCVDRPT